MLCLVLPRMAMWTPYCVYLSMFSCINPWCLLLTAVLLPNMLYWVEVERCQFVWETLQDLTRKTHVVGGIT